jgi:type VI secretion system secreted protein VgrG
MAVKPTQGTRIAALTTPLGKDVLVLNRLDAAEGLSELFEFRIEALSTEANINFDRAIGEDCCVSMVTYDGGKRHFSGKLVETQWLGKRSDYYCYQLVLRPWLWLLGHRSDCKIFSNKSIPDIVKAVLKESGLGSIDDRLSGSYPVLEYCVQYRETDLNFVSRLMEEAGIYFFFEHMEGSHTLVLADSISCHTAKEGGAKLVYRPSEGTQRRDVENLYVWHAGRRFRSGKFTLNDYDYKKPNASLVSEKEGGGSYQHGSLEIYDFPGRFEEKSVGEQYAKLRLEAEQSADKRCHADGDAVSCRPGRTITLAEHPDSSQNTDYLVIRASHSFVSDLYRSGGPADEGPIYTGHYEYLPKKIQFRRPQLTPKPVIYGAQTAKVAGDGEIDVDEQGRIIVHFYWDRKKKDSRRVRIAQVWSGKEWGGIIIPRVGQEVVVEFIEGDPDRPLVIGTVYNAENTVPYGLPSEKTIGGIKSNSSEGGGGYNEFVFDDKKGSELIRMHGQKDLQTKIEHDEKWDVGNDIKIDIGNNHTEKIGNTMKVTANVKMELVVGQSKITMDPGSITIQSPLITIKADAMLEAKAPMTQVKGDGMLILKGGVVLIN